MPEGRRGVGIWEEGDGSKAGRGDCGKEREFF